MGAVVIFHIFVKNKLKC